MGWGEIRKWLRTPNKTIWFRNIYLIHNNDSKINISKFGLLQLFFNTIYFKRDLNVELLENKSLRRFATRRTQVISVQNHIFNSTNCRVVRQRGPTEEHSWCDLFVFAIIRLQRYLRGITIS